MSTGAGDPGGFSLSLVTESFAVRALLGSVAAALLVALVVGLGVLRSPGARRAAVLAPAVVAALAAIASAGEVFLPRILVATASADGPVVEHLGEYRGLQAGTGVDVLLISYLVVAGMLVARRLVGTRISRRHLASARPAPADSALTAMLEGLARKMDVTCPRLLLQPGCPGGAFTAGLRRPAVVLDPELVHRLDAEEIEGLLAHELAHHARRDGLVGLAVGLARDLAWFLAPLYLTCGWLHREQEESADDLASRCTGRPAALASGILKVWDRTGAASAAPGTCAAVALAWPPSGVVLPGRGGRRAWQIVSARVERLIAAVPAPSGWRRRTEAALAFGVMVASAAAALSLPSWIARDLGADSLDFLYLAGSGAGSPAESPAFATFRALTPTDPGSSTAAATATGVATRSTTADIESRAELLAGQRRWSPNADGLSWGSQEQRTWEVGPPGNVRRARPLVYTLNDAGAQVGVFVVGAAEG
jgi:Zn-dependent protease with chaperone function